MNGTSQGKTSCVVCVCVFCVSKKSDPRTGSTFHGPRSSTWLSRKKTWVSNSSIATYLVRGPLGFGPIQFLMDSFEMFFSFNRCVVLCCDLMWLMLLYMYPTTLTCWWSWMLKYWCPNGGVSKKPFFGGEEKEKNDWVLGLWRTWFFCVHTWSWWEFHMENIPQRWKNGSFIRINSTFRFQMIFLLQKTAEMRIWISHHNSMDTMQRLFLWKAPPESRVNRFTCCWSTNWKSGQIITTSAEVTLNGGLVRESPKNSLNSGLGIILICPGKWKCKKHVIVFLPWQIVTSSSLTLSQPQNIFAGFLVHVTVTLTKNAHSTFSPGGFPFRSFADSVFVEIATTFPAILPFESMPIFFVRQKAGSFTTWLKLHGSFHPLEVKRNVLYQEFHQELSQDFRVTLRDFPEKKCMKFRLAI